jgi:hypothetical protein
VSTNKKKGITGEKTMVNTLAVFKRVQQIQKLLVLSGQELTKIYE